MADDAKAVFASPAGLKTQTENSNIQVPGKTDLCVLQKTLKLIQRRKK